MALAVTVSVFSATTAATVTMTITGTATVSLTLLTANVNITGCCGSWTVTFTFTQIFTAIGTVSVVATFIITITVTVSDTFSVIVSVTFTFSVTVAFAMTVNGTNMVNETNTVSVMFNTFWWHKEKNIRTFISILCVFQMVSRWFTVFWKQHQEMDFSLCGKNRTSWHWVSMSGCRWAVSCWLFDFRLILRDSSIQHCPHGLGSYYALSVMHQSAQSVLWFWLRRDFV